MESRIYLSNRATELLNHPYITPKGYFDGRYAIRHSEDIRFSNRTEYTLATFAKKLGIKLPSPTLLKKWTQMTEDNCHTEVLLEVVGWAKDNCIYNSKYEHLAVAFDEIKTLHDNMNEMPIPTARFCLQELLLSEIKENFGYTIYKQIYDCM